MLLRIVVGAWRIIVAALFIAAFKLAVRSAVFLNAIMIAVAAIITAGARSHAKMRSIGLGGFNDGGGHIINSLLDGDLLVELLKVLVSGLRHEDTLGGHERNFKGRDSVSDLDGSSRNSSASGLEEFSHIDVLDGFITILASLTVAFDVLLDVIELILESVTGLAVNFSIMDPEEGVDISDVGTDGIIPVVSKAAGTNRSGSGNINVRGKNKLVEDRAREAGLDVDDEFLEHVLRSHGVDDSLHLVAIKIATIREAHSTLTAVIIEENENIIIRTRLKSLATANARHILTSHDLNPVVAVNIWSSIILRNSGIHIRAVGLVDDLSGLGVTRVTSNIILHHNNDTFIRDTHVVDDLIGVANISLVTIVVVTITTSSEENPSLSFKLLLGKTSKRISCNCNSS